MQLELIIGIAVGALMISCGAALLAVSFWRQGEQFVFESAVKPTDTE